MSPFKKILVATDFSQHASAAVRLATELAKAAGDCELRLLHVLDLVPYSLPDGMPIYDAVTLTRVRDDATRRLSEQKQEALKSGVRRVEATLLDGQPSYQIVRVAADWDAGVIVIGTHGRRGFSRLLLGSVAERVVRKAHCPVLVVPLRAEDSP
jgi:nucleotide-binding universal stress UspA family protein